MGAKRGKRSWAKGKGSGGMGKGIYRVTIPHLAQNNTSKINFMYHENSKCTSHVRHNCLMGYYGTLWISC